MPKILRALFAAAPLCIVAACGGGEDSQAPLAVSEAGPGTFEAGTVADGKRLCSITVVAHGTLRLAAEVRGLEGDAYWRVQVNGGLPSTGRVMPDGAGGASAEWEAPALEGDHVQVELFAFPLRHGAAAWQSATLRAW